MRQFPFESLGIEVLQRGVGSSMPTLFFASIGDLVVLTMAIEKDHRPWAAAWERM